MRSRFTAVSSLVAFVCLCLCPVACQRGETATPPRPNVLLVSLDALRADHLSSYGYGRHTSPFLDRLAAEGVRFSHAFANTHGTPPSHTTLFTSLYQETHRVSFRRRGEKKRNDVVPAALHLLPELLQEAGYSTLAVTGAGYVSKPFGFDQGFDDFKAGDLDIGDAAELLFGKIREAVHWGKPVFAFFHTYEVHSPYEPPQSYRKLFGTQSSSFAPTSENLVSFQDRAGDLEEEDVLFLEESYDAEIRYADDQLERLFRRLEELGFLDHALVVILSDHGEEFGEHGGLLHRISLYDELLHVPLIVWGPQVAKAVVDPRMVSLVDVAPTILSAAGIAPPASMEGKNLLSDARQPPEDEDAAVFSQYTSLLYSIRTHRWKLIEDKRRNRQLLFDLRVDPGEHHNLRKRRPEIAHELAERLERWRQSVPVLEDLDAAMPTLDEDEVKRLRALGYLD